MLAYFSYQTVVFLLIAGFVTWLLPQFKPLPAAKRRRFYQGLLGIYLLNLGDYWLGQTLPPLVNWLKTSLFLLLLYGLLRLIILPALLLPKDKEKDYLALGTVVLLLLWLLVSWVIWR